MDLRLQQVVLELGNHQLFTIQNVQCLQDQGYEIHTVDGPSQIKVEYHWMGYTEQQPHQDTHLHWTH